MIQKSDRMKSLRSHGITKIRRNLNCHKTVGLRTTRIRFNYRMTDIQAALGLSQMKRLSQIIEERERIFKRSFTGGLTSENT